MKIIIINASPRKKGNTAILCGILEQKLKSFEDVDVEQLFLCDLNLGFCKGCCNCLTKGESYCPEKSDDRAALEEKILSADGVVFASPVYAMNMTALMKNFMDRFAFTMHRPRFFRQYTMIAAVTGSVGLRETIESISQLSFCGFNIVEKLGIKAPNPLINPSITDEKLIKKIETKAENFYKIIKAQKPANPTLINVIAFSLQRKCFAKLKDKAPADWEYYDKKGWFDPKCKYFTDNVKIPFYKKMLAVFVSSF